MTKCRQQCHHDAHVYSARQKSKRRRSRPFPASFSRTTKTRSLRILLVQFFRNPTRLARISRAMQLSPACAILPARFRRQVLIQFQEESIYLGVTENRLIQRVCLLHLSSGEEDKKPPRLLSVKLFEGVPLFLSICLIKTPALYIKYRAHAHALTSTCRPATYRVSLTTLGVSPMSLTRHAATLGAAITTLQVTLATLRVMLAKLRVMSCNTLSDAPQRFECPSRHSTRRSRGFEGLSQT